MPTNVLFAHDLNYIADPRTGKSLPGLRLSIENPADPALAIDIVGYLDSGACDTLIQGTLATVIGIEDLMSGARKMFHTARGGAVEARVHRVLLRHDLLGSHEMEVAFATADTTRNLLGLDFFDKFKICSTSASNVCSLIDCS